MEIKYKDSNLYLEKMLNRDYDNMTKEEMIEKLIELDIQNYYFKRKEKLIEEEKNKKKKEEEKVTKSQKRDRNLSLFCY